MRSAYIVSYDVSHPKRLRRTYKTMLGFGEHVQLSVFRCELSEADLVRMKAKLDAIINHREDQILIVDIGPVEGRAEDMIETLGRAYTPRERVAVVI